MCNFIIQTNAYVNRYFYNLCNSYKVEFISLIILTIGHNETFNNMLLFDFYNFYYQRYISISLFFYCFSLFLFCFSFFFSFFRSCITITCTNVCVFNAHEPNWIIGAHCIMRSQIGHAIKHAYAWNTACRAGEHVRAEG